MHEYALAQNIIETALSYADGAKVKYIALCIGGASGVSGESIAMYFDIIAEGTGCERAELDIEPITPVLKCGDCGALFEQQLFNLDCVCGGPGYPTGTGKEFYVKYIEVEDTAEANG